MGFLGGDNEPQSDSDRLVSEQLRANQEELEQKKSDLFQTRLDIIKGQGAQSFTPRDNANRVNRGKKPSINLKGKYIGF